jgi:hypothetical protein
VSSLAGRLSSWSNTTPTPFREFAEEAIKPAVAESVAR